MQRIYVLGSSGSGKSTLSHQISEKLDIPHYDLDELFYMPGRVWQPAPTESFQEKVALATSGERWIIEGVQEEAAQIILPKADTLIWIDPSPTQIFHQLCSRTFDRIVNKRQVCNGKIETWRQTLFSTNSIFIFATKSYLGNQRDLGPIFNGSSRPSTHSHLDLVHLRDRKSIADFVRNL